MASLDDKIFEHYEEIKPADGGNIPPNAVRWICKYCKRDDTKFCDRELDSCFAKCHILQIACGSGLDPCTKDLDAETWTLNPCTGSIPPEAQKTILASWNDVPESLKSEVLKVKETLEKSDNVDAERQRRRKDVDKEHSNLFIWVEDWGGQICHVTCADTKDIFYCCCWMSHVRHVRLLGDEIHG